MFHFKHAFFTVLFSIVSFTNIVLADTDALVKAMADHLSCYPLEILHFNRQEPIITREDICLASIYHETGIKPIWVTAYGPGKNASIILQYLKDADKEGLDPQDYQVDELQKLWFGLSPDSLAKLDALLTYNSVKYVHDVRFGRLKPYLADPKLFAEAGHSSFDPVRTVMQLTQAPDLDTFLRKLPPDNIHYAGLKRKLVDYLQLEMQDDWSAIAPKPSIRLGDIDDERIPLIRSRLAQLYGVLPSPANLLLYDDELEKVVRNFQRQHGLKADGIMGQKTIEELNVPPAVRLAQIKINMARWRWQDHQLGDEYIVVNIANYQLDAYRDGKLVLSLPVIVGKSQHQTPVFSDQIRYVEFHPYWNVPPSIAQREKLPKLINNPFYLVEKNIRLFSNWQADGVELDSTVIDWSLVSRAQMAKYKLRQEPGPFNALGRVKFVFPNKYSVYLHDTPRKNLFEEHYRSFSHGCIRVFSPEKLALFVLQGEAQEWSEEKVTELFATEERKVIRIRRLLPIHLTYQTAWLDKDDRIHFNGDVYERDKKLLKALLAR